MQGVTAMTDTTTPTTPTTGEHTPPKPITFNDIASNPQGLTTLNDTAKLFSRHAETLRRWVRSKNNTFVKPVNINGFYYFQNSAYQQPYHKQ